MTTFEFDRSLQIYLYGINRYSELLADKLGNNGFDVHSFIDKRAKDLDYTYKSYSVVDVDAFLPNSDDCVIITLQNALNHENVARLLAEKGICRILFLPLRELYNGENRKMCNAYNSIVYFHDFSTIEIPTFDNLQAEIRETRIIPDGKTKIVYVPFDLIYTATVEGDYSDLPILDFKPYRQLFSFINGKRSDISMYLERYGVNSCNYINDYTDNQVLTQRRMLYDLWEKHYYFRDGYFEVAAPVAEWNRKGHFNLKEGQHRILYQILKGEFFVPIRLDTETYNMSISYVVEHINSKSLQEWKECIIGHVDC